MKVSCDEKGIVKASEIVKNGGVIIFPTDTVYGIGCDPFNDKAIGRIYEIKGRNTKKPLPILSHSIEHLEKIVQFDEIAKKLATKFWPGPLTIILESTNENLMRSKYFEKNIAVRIPNNKCALSLLEKCDFVTGTSANRSGVSSFNDPKKCYQSDITCDLFLDGGIIDSLGESTIIEIIDNQVKLHREGILSRQEILRTL